MLFVWSCGNIRYRQTDRQAGRAQMIVVRGMGFACGWLRIQTHSEYMIWYNVTWYDIQGDSGGICITLGNDSMSYSKQKSSYEHGSDFELLRSYGHFLIPVYALMWTALTEPAGGLWLTACIASINFASWLAHQTSAVHNRAAACVGAGGVIFENQL